MRTKNIAIIAATVAALALVIVLVAAQPAAGHYAVDEVNAFGPAGPDPVQRDHEHPHARTVWYAHENGTVWESPVDLYELRLIGNATIPVAAAPEPEPETSGENFEDIPFTVIFEIREASALCPDRTERDDVRTTGLTHWSHALIYHSDIVDQTRDGTIHSPDGGSNSPGQLLFLGGAIDTERGIARVTGIAEHDNPAAFCDSAREFFVFDAEIRCDGSGLTMTSRDSDGYTVTATDEQVHAACYWG